MLLIKYNSMIIIIINYKYIKLTGYNEREIKYNETKWNI